MWVGEHFCSRLLKKEVTSYLGIYFCADVVQLIRASVKGDRFSSACGLLVYKTKNYYTMHCICWVVTASNAVWFLDPQDGKHSVNRNIGGFSDRVYWCHSKKDIPMELIESLLGA